MSKDIGCQPVGSSLNPSLVLTSHKAVVTCVYFPQHSSLIYFLSFMKFPFLEVQKLVSTDKTNASSNVSIHFLPVHPYNLNCTSMVIFNFELTS